MEGVELLRGVVDVDMLSSGQDGFNFQPHLPSGLPPWTVHKIPVWFDHRHRASTTKPHRNFGKPSMAEAHLEGEAES